MQATALFQTICAWRSVEFVCFVPAAVEMPDSEGRSLAMRRIWLYSQSLDSLRQVHLGKGKPRETYGSVLAANLRAISISSMIWRVYNKAR